VFTYPQGMLGQGDTDLARCSGL